ncbi:hypothetical protein [Vampirovibrio chlorellavorus]|uniref:hypothetical protein n=1 Tax=Vampirovibrio chlorellavorus TaxID=758823 RepID=UPI0026F0A4D5|nr:hypothetical protein [Vampirovibrio chlorellavorus]
MLNWDALGKGGYRDKTGKQVPPSTLPGNAQPAGRPASQSSHQSLPEAAPRGLAILLPKRPPESDSLELSSPSAAIFPNPHDDHLNGSLDDSLDHPADKGLQLLAEAAVTQQPRSILKRSSPAGSAERAPVPKRVRFQEPLPVMTVEGHPVYLSRKAYADLRSSQRQLSWRFNALEGASMIVNGTPAETALTPIINLYYGQIEPHQARLNQRFRTLMRSQPGEAVPWSAKAMLNDWQWQKMLTGLMERCLKSTRQVKAIQDNEFLESDVQDVLTLVEAQRQSLAAIFSHSPEEAAETE